MYSYHNDQTVKDKYVLRMQKHIEMDELVQGTGWDIYDTKGCAVGCTLNSYDHDGYETELGLPVWLAYLEDTLHEGVSQEYAKTFALNFLQAIPLGLSDSDFNKINAKFLILLIKDNLIQIEKVNITDKLKKHMMDTIKKCLDLQEKIAISGEMDIATAREIEAAEREIEEAAWAAKAAAWAVGEVTRASKAVAQASSAIWEVSWASIGAGAPRATRASGKAACAVGKAAWAVGETACADAYERYADYLIKLLAEKEE